MRSDATKTISSAIASWTIITLLASAASWRLAQDFSSELLSLRALVVIVSFGFLFVFGHLFFLPLWHLSMRLLSGTSPPPLHIGQKLIVDTASLLAAFITWGGVLGGAVTGGVAFYSSLSRVQSVALRVGLSAVVACLLLALGLVLAEAVYKVIRLIMSGGLSEDLRDADGSLFLWRWMRMWQGLAHRIYPVSLTFNAEAELRRLVMRVLEGEITSYERFVQEANVFRPALRSPDGWEALLSLLKACCTSEGAFCAERLSSQLGAINDLMERHLRPDFSDVP